MKRQTLDLFRWAWRLLDPHVPRTQAERRLRAVVLLGATTFGLSALVTGPYRSSVISDGSSSTTPASLVDQAPPDAPAEVITRIDTTDRVVFVTIDDGFTREPSLPHALRQLQMPVTLFLVDRAITSGTAFFESLPVATIGSHTRSHTNLRGLPEPTQRTEVCTNSELIASSFGTAPVLFRPPYGTYDEATRVAVNKCGIRFIVLWEATFEDGELQLRSSSALRPGDIILLHFRPGLTSDLLALNRHLESVGLRPARLEDYLPI